MSSLVREALTRGGGLAPAAALGGARWYRKPRWLPMAPTKLYRIPQHARLPEDEKRELQRLYNNYRTQVHAVRSFMVAQRVARETALAELQARREREGATTLLDERFKLNDEWNARVAVEREAALAEKRKAHEARIIDGLQRSEERSRRLEALVSEQFREKRELAKKIITKEMLDEAIAKSFDNVVSYDYAIDLEGNVYQDEVAKASGTAPETTI